MMKHFILTHFNQILWSKDKNRQKTHTTAWLDRRFELFEKFCFPSVYAQSDSRFYWICLFDINTPLSYMDKIEGYKKLLPQFVPLFVTEEESKYGNDLAVKQKISALLEEDDKIIISTQLDSDDAIHRDFVKKVNDLSSRTTVDNTVFIFNYGYQYYEHYDFLLKLYYPNNHFPVMVEKDRNQLKLAFSINHSHLRKMKLKRSLHLVEIDNREEPFWIEVIHSKNVSNDVRITFRPKEILHLFKQQFMLPGFTWSAFGIDLNYQSGQQFEKYFKYYIPNAFKQIRMKCLKKIRQ